MKRLEMTPREDWQAALEADGMIWHSPYWNESACYELTPRDVDSIRAATESLYEMFIAAGQFVISRNLFQQLDIPDFIVRTLVKAWEAEPPALNYGRFDLGYNGDGQPKLFEFNCDTPTSLLEAAVIQWRWKEQALPDAAQANEIHEHLLAKWSDIAPYLPSADVHVTAMRDAVGEDLMTATYMAELAREAGLRPLFIEPKDIGWDARRNCFVDLETRPIRTLYKLYPWEWLLREEFGKNIVTAGTFWIEPLWKAMWSNKAILPVLWQLYPEHPLLLEASFKPLSCEHVVKPIFGREGRGVRFSSEHAALVDQTSGKNIYQRRFDLKPYGESYPVIGSWIVDGKFAGLGVREGGPITNNASAFVPHFVSAG
jgi:glutathionylspermidine synthase